jgi:hypothetical protein
MPSGLEYCVVPEVTPDVSEEATASIFYPENGVSLLRNNAVLQLRSLKLIYYNLDNDCPFSNMTCLIVKITTKNTPNIFQEIKSGEL